MFTGLLRLTINQLILSNVYLGDSYYFINVKIKPFIFGYKNSYHILNLSFTQMQFKILISFLVNIISVRQQILIVKELDAFNLKVFLDKDIVENIFFYDKKWIGGILTNYKTVINCSKFKRNPSFKNSKINLRYMPSLLFLFNINLSKWPLQEAFLLDIPIASVINSNSKWLDYVNYPLVGNNQSFESIYLYLSILKNAILMGKQKERLDIIRIL